jgi:3-keto-5-aminohexanoate cleavage enzyme
MFIAESLIMKLPAYGALYGGNPPQGINQEPLIINACLSGNITNRAGNPYIPRSVQEITDNAGAVIEAGASILHVHAYETDGTPTWRPEIFARIFESIRSDHPDVVLVATTSGRLHPEFEKRSAVLELDGKAKPDMASLTLASLNFPKQASINDPETVQQLCQRMRDRSITPELEAFDLGMLNYAFYLQRKGMLPLHCYINLLLGSLGTVPGRTLDLANLVREIPQDWTWAAAGIGRYQLPINVAAMTMGGNVRVGLEDNPFYDYSEREPGKNEELIKRLVRIAGELGRTIASPGDTRQRLQLDNSDNWSATQVTIRKMKSDDMQGVMGILAEWNMAPIKADANIPAPERDRIEIDNTFVAELQGQIVGTCGYYILNETHAETASLAVDPEFLGCGIGFQLQEARLREMRKRGIRHLRTESDRPEVIHWYINKFGYRMTGTNPKKHAFGHPGRDFWTILELDLGN